MERNMKMTNDEKIILPDSPGVATPVTMTMWKARGADYYFDESVARYVGCTHFPCKECGKPARKPFVRCRECQEREDIRLYNVLPKKMWDGKGMIFSDAYDEYFNSLGEAQEYLEDLDEEKTLEDLRLLICKPQYARLLDVDDFADDLSEDGEAPDWLIDAIEEFNKAISGHEPLSYMPGKIAVDLTKEK